MSDVARWAIARWGRFSWGIDILNTPDPAIFGHGRFQASRFNVYDKSYARMTDRMNKLLPSRGGTSRSVDAATFGGGHFGGSAFGITGGGQPDAALFGKARFDYSRFNTYINLYEQYLKRMEKL